MQTGTYIERMALLYSTGSDVQYPWINHNGKNKKNVYMTESLLCTAQTNTALQINYTSIKKKRKINTTLVSSCHCLTQNAFVTFHSTSNKAPRPSLTLRGPVCGPASSSCLPLHSPLLPNNPTDFCVPQTGQSGS